MPNTCPAPCGQHHECVSASGVVRCTYDTCSGIVAPSRSSFASSNQGFQDVGIRRKLARAYWRFAPALRSGVWAIWLGFRRSRLLLLYTVYLLPPEHPVENVLVRTLTMCCIFTKRETIRQKTTPMSPIGRHNILRKRGHLFWHRLGLLDVIPRTPRFSSQTFLSSQRSMFFFLKPNGSFPAACCRPGGLLSACSGTNLLSIASSAVSHKRVQPYRIPLPVVTAR